MLLLQPEQTSSSGPAVGLGESLFPVPLCLLPSALLFVLFVLSVAPLHVLLSVLSVAPLLVCQSDLSVDLSVSCVVPLSVALLFLEFGLTVLAVSDLAGSLNNVTDLFFVLGLAKVFYETSLQP